MARQRTTRVLLFWIVLAQGASVSLLQAEDPCNLLLLGTSITDNGDGDGFADTHETVQIGISVQPRCTDPAVEELSDCVAWLSTESPAIDCMRRPEILIGDLPANGPAVTAEDTFEIKIGSIDRQALGLGPDDPLVAVLTLDIRCFDGAVDRSFRELLTLPLDLNVLDLGQTPTGWSEDFEGGGIDPGNPLLGTAFFAENLDAGLPGNSGAEGLANADGWRCAYTDPDWQNSNSYNDPQGETCYPGVNLAQADAIFWQMDGSPISGTPDGGRAFRGEKSMYYGVFLGQVDEGFTTPLTTVESVATFDLINLGVGHPQLSFWQQVSLADHRSIGSRIGRNVDRGVVQILLHDAAGNRTSDWMNLVPIQNSYAQQAEDNYTNCMFDPVDDGNTEDDFFDPTDPLRDLGPSSTCFPSYSWSFMGSTTGSFSTIAVGNATTPPVLDDLPSLGSGEDQPDRVPRPAGASTLSGHRDQRRLCGDLRPAVRHRQGRT